MKPSRLLAAVLACSLVAGAAGCGDDAGDGPHLVVFAAASLTEAFTDAEVVDVTYSFAGSGALVTQVTEGAPADVIATADLASMQTLVDAGLVDAPTTFARNQLQILVAPGNPQGITGLADLADEDLEVVLADETVPAGRYAAEALAKAGVTVSPVSKEIDVKSTVAKVTSGEADAAIVYVTDVTAAGDEGDGVDIPAGLNVTAEYPIAVVKATDDREAAEAFVESAVDGDVHEALEARGFLAA